MTHRFEGQKAVVVYKKKAFKRSVFWDFFAGYPFQKKLQSVLMNIDSRSVRGVASNGEGKNETREGETGRKGKKRACTSTKLPEWVVVPFAVLMDSITPGTVPIEHCFT